MKLERLTSTINYGLTIESYKYHTVRVRQFPYGLDWKTGCGTTLDETLQSLLRKS